jgi:phospholipid/cholesterol/gamma-HCH transport system ATP-binding protein
MQKRVGVARAIAHQPRIMLYDEPTTGLDPVTADTINDLIIRAREKLAVTTVAVTHDLHSANKIGDRVAVMVNGKITLTGTPAEIWKSQDLTVRRFVNASGTGGFTD